MDFGTLFRTNVGHHPDKLALAVENRQLTYRELEDRVLRLAGGFSRNLGIAKGDSVGIFLRDGIEWVESYLAASILGAWPVPINFRYGRRELTHIAKDATLKALLYDEPVAGIVDALDAAGSDGGPCRIFVGEGEPPSDVLRYDDLLDEPFTEQVYIAPDDIHTISYTSGTTGLPKGALYTHLNTICGGFLGTVMGFGLRSSDVFMTTTPLCHRVGQSRLINSLGLGGTLVVMPHFEPDKLIELTDRFGGTVLSLVPTMARRFVEAAQRRNWDGGSLRIILFTGEALPAALRKTVMDAFPRAICYSYFASTETSMVSLLSQEHQLTHASSVGKLMPGIEVRIVDDEGRDVPPGEPGEMWVRSSQPGTFAVCRGYITSFPDEEPRFVGDWFRTGDIARLDPDGFLYIVDRKKDMILSGGMNIASKEVEEVLTQHPAVAEAAVIGVPDAQFGEAVAAYVVLRAGHQCTAEELIEHCRATMASFKKPRYVQFVPELPRNSVGKLNKLELRERARTDFQLTAGSPR